MYIIAVDAGGSKCKARLYNSNGQMLSEAQSGAANMFSDFDGAVNAISQVANTLLTQASLTHKECILSIGAAGASLPAVKLAFNSWSKTQAFERCILNSDLYISCLAASKGANCAFVVLGTGSSIAIYQDTQLQQLGGHGFLLGDEGSGAWLGKTAISWYLKQLENSLFSETTEPDLFQALGEQVGFDINTIVEHYGRASASDFAALAPSILSVQDTSKKVQNWLSQGVQYIAALLAQHAQDIPVFLGGGISFVYQAPLQKLLNKPVKISQQDATYGAYLAAIIF